MGNYVVKPYPDEDYYVVWNETVEAPEFAGPRDEAREYLVRYSSDRRRGETRLVDERLRWTDVHGTSAMWPSTGGYCYGWDDDVFIYEQRGILRRKNLRALCEALERDDEESAWDLLEPFEDADEVFRG